MSAEQRNGCNERKVMGVGVDDKGEGMEDSSGCREGVEVGGGGGGVVATPAKEGGRVFEMDEKKSMGKKR